MCIDLVGIQYIRKIHYFGRAIQDARYALVNVGGRMVHVPDLMRYASVLHQVAFFGGVGGRLGQGVQICTPPPQIFGQNAREGGRKILKILLKKHEKIVNF